MKEFFVERIETYSKGRFIGAGCHTILLEEEDAQEKQIIVTWDNVRRLSDCYSDLLNFYIIFFRKGMCISFDNKPRGVKEPKQWVDSQPDIELKFSYKIRKQVSFNEIFDWHNADEAAEYIKEHYPFLAVNRIATAFKANKEIVNNV